MPMNGRRAVLFANGALTDPQAVRALAAPGDLLVAVDGGLRHLQALGLRPDVLVGDLDSVTEAEVAALRVQGVRVEQHPAQKDETDLELAVALALEMGCAQIVIAGALGGRLDMTLANVFLLALPALAMVDARLDDGVEQVMLIRPGAQGRQIDGAPGDRVSLLPLGGPASGIITEGLLYPLRDETLYPERTRGISNEMLQPPARVRLADGMLICVHARKSARMDER